MTSSNFKKEYARLNPQQRQAVDTIEGPVMVIAGAGTGKTQTIALRIANILKTTQTPPQNILCLTFTENAALNMRQRLLSIIGPPAYQVKIHTFHSFCNEIILTHPDQFISARSQESLDELDRLEIIQKLLKKMPADCSLRPFGEPFFYQKQIISSIQSLKRENVTPLKLKKLINGQKQFLKKSLPLYQQLKSLRLNKQLSSQVEDLVRQLVKVSPLSLKTLFQTQLNLFSSGAFNVGRAKNPAINFKNAILKIIEDLQKQSDRQLALQKIYQSYQRLLRKLAKYDFEDMIFFVIKAFSQDPNLLLEYQERFLYVLVDEYQDTNSAQNKILQYLTAYHPSPNLFVVGDDDQSIFRFQGAAIENLLNFQKTYQPQLIALKNNYRSHQLILDSGLSLIAHNKNRLGHILKGIDKTLVSQKSYDPDPINLFVAESVLEENYFMAQKIKKLINNGVDPRQIALLYRANKDPLSLLPLLDNLSIPYQISSGNNILDQVHIQQLTQLFKFLHDPSQDRLLFDLLISPFTQIDSFDLLKLSRYSYRHRLPLFDLIQKPSLKLKKDTIEKLKKFLKNLANCRRDLANLPFDKSFNSIIRHFDYLPHLLKKNNIVAIGQLDKFYNFLRRQFDQGHSFPQVLDRLDLLRQNNISIQKDNFNQNIKAINLMTVHKAKGLEFDHVFIFQSVDKKWGNNRGHVSLKLPLGIIQTETMSSLTDTNEEERRLFYVALTRAKKQIHLSYSKIKDNGRPQLPSIFLSEIKPNLIEKVEAPRGLKASALTIRFSLNKNQIFHRRAAKLYLKDYLAHHYHLNISHINSYLTCPFCFYYKTILRIPAVKNKNLSFGTAVHFALKYLYDRLKSQSQLISLEEFIRVFKSALKKEKLSPADHQDVLVIALANLPDYYHHYKKTFSADCLSEYDFTQSKIFVDNIPITGKIDRIQPVSGSTNNLPHAHVVDYKTGQPDNKSVGPDSDYYRQLVFYKILADNDPNFPFHITSGLIDFIQKNKQGKFIQKKVEYKPEDVNNLRLLAKQVYQKILNLDFNHLGHKCRDHEDLHRLLK